MDEKLNSKAILDPNRELTEKKIPYRWVGGEVVESPRGDKYEMIASLLALANTPDEKAAIEIISKGYGIDGATFEKIKAYVDGLSQPLILA